MCWRATPDWLTVILTLPSARQVVNALLPFGAGLPETVERRSFDDAARMALAKVGYLSRGTISGEYAFPIRVPVSRNGAVRYILSAVVRPRAISALLDAQRLPPDWVGVVLDGDARIVARTLNPELSVGQLASESLRAELAHSPQGWFHGHTLERMSVYTAYHRSSSSNWSVAVGIPAAVVEAGARQTAGAMALGVLSAGMLAFGIAVTLGRRISKPIKSLAAAAKTLGRAEHSGVARPSGVEEIDILSRVLDDASAALRNNLTELRRAEERFRQIFEAAPSAMVMVSEDEQDSAGQRPSGDGLRLRAHRADRPAHRDADSRAFPRRARNGQKALRRRSPNAHNGRWPGVVWSSERRQ